MYNSIMVNNCFISIKTTFWYYTVTPYVLARRWPHDFQKMRSPWRHLQAEPRQPSHRLSYFFQLPAGNNLQFNSNSLFQDSYYIILMKANAYRMSKGRMLEATTNPYKFNFELINNCSNNTLLYILYHRHCI